MKRILFIFLCLVLGIWVGREVFAGKNIPSAGTQSQQPVITPTPSSISGIPVTLRIPKIGVNAVVESVGMDSQGRMDVPKEVMHVAWYNLGSRPGEKGSAVIDGHLDTVTGAPAVFYQIRSLQPGDKLEVTDTNKKIHIFTVTSVTSYPYDDLPMQQIFASNDRARLNLITCGGTWDIKQKNYSNRIVVYSVLSSSQ